eukprot:Cvel_9709.t2-p1 / transcript=Cvel_9709.t2 / gene=Cvel_9709 / organism=Chromera_velia_CCMP2878 / gene_product=hypothetical protein / transcript_product=hypothetical protein / location=Cvel_scaffold566:64680-65786(-) / protein_length=369 / sequence_SO=supercontig / SO=protein_coding / is_pseudo=false
MVRWSMHKNNGITELHIPVLESNTTGVKALSEYRSFSRSFGTPQELIRVLRTDCEAENVPASVQAHAKMMVIGRLEGNVRGFHANQYHDFSDKKRKQMSSGAYTFAFQLSDLPGGEKQLDWSLAGFKLATEAKLKGYKTETKIIMGKDQRKETLKTEHWYGATKQEVLVEYDKKIGTETVQHPEYENDYVSTELYLSLKKMTESVAASGYYQVYGTQVDDEVPLASTPNASTSAKEQQKEQPPSWPIIFGEWGVAVVTSLLAEPWAMLCIVGGTVWLFSRAFLEKQTGRGPKCRPEGSSRCQERERVRPRHTRIYRRSRHAAEREERSAVASAYDPLTRRGDCESTMSPTDSELANQSEGTSERLAGHE